MESFSVSRTDKASLIPDDIERRLRETKKRLRGVYIENLDYRKVIDRYDRRESFIYMDPPYDVPGARCYYRHFKKKDFITFRDKCREIKGKFLISLNDSPYIREIFKEYRIEEIEVRYAIMKGKKYKELIITNYAPQPTQKKLF